MEVKAMFSKYHHHLTSSALVHKTFVLWNHAFSTKWATFFTSHCKFI